MNTTHIDGFSEYHLKETIGEIIEVKNKNIFFKTEDDIVVQLLKSTSIKCGISFSIGDKYELIYHLETKKSKEKPFCQLKKAQEFFENLHPNVILYGEIVSITKYGLFINLEYITGLIHWSNLIDKNNLNTKPLIYLESNFKLNEFVKVKVLKYENEKLQLEKL
jgi:predicted RNA-binding protein with RPS1 domain